MILRVKKKKKWRQHIPLGKTLWNIDTFLLNVCWPKGDCLINKSDERVRLENEQKYCQQQTVENAQYRMYAILRHYVANGQYLNITIYLFFF